MTETKILWSASMPGAGAADLVADFLDSVSDRISGGELADAQTVLRSDKWKTTFDLNGMPQDVRQIVDVYLHMAFDALRDPVDTEAALEALDHARKAIGR